MEHRTFAELVAERPEIFDGMACRPGPLGLSEEYSDSLIPKHMWERVMAIRRKRRGAAQNGDAAPNTNDVPPTFCSQQTRISNMFQKITVAVGQRLRDLSPTVLGLRPVELIVGELYTAIDGRQYARLVSATDSSIKKTIAVAVLEERRRYTVIASD
jgi:hypothetical protein